MIAKLSKETEIEYPCLEVVFETPKELDIFNTLIGYYPYQSMEKLRKEFGNKFPNVTTEEVISVVEKISKALDSK